MKQQQHVRRVRTKFGKRRILVNRGVRRKAAWKIPSGAYVVNLSPDEYLGKTTYGKSDPRDYDEYYDFAENKSLPISKLAEHIVNPNVNVTVPFVGDDPDEHEGRHRAVAAKVAGIKEIPVIISLPKERRSELGRKFVEKIYPENFKEGKISGTAIYDLNKWGDRFERGLPHVYMDSAYLKKYEELLKEEGLK